MVLSRTGRSGMRFTCLLFLPLLLVHGCAKKDWESHWQETISGAQVTAEELIVRVEDFLAEEPPLQYASEARFTIGFTWAEALEKYDEARRWFEELLEKDPFPTDRAVDVSANAAVSARIFLAKTDLAI